jgi:hypothetical protein
VPPRQTAKRPGGIQHARQQGRQRDEQDIGKGDAPDTRTARSNRSSPRKPEAIAITSHGIASVRHQRQHDQDRGLAPRRPLRRSRWGRRCAPRFFENIGTKAMLNAPSPKNRRKRFGSERRSRKASASGPVPTSAAIMMSRTNPRMRLSNVQAPTVRNPSHQPDRLHVSARPFRPGDRSPCAQALLKRSAAWLWNEISARSMSLT